MTHLNGVQQYWYDANGNMLTRNEGGTKNFTQGWDTENRMQAMTNTLGQVTQYFYDGDGNRVKKVDTTGTTIYVGALYEKNVSTALETSYYPSAGSGHALRAAAVSPCDKAECCLTSQRIIWAAPR